MRIDKSIAAGFLISTLAVNAEEVKWPVPPAGYAAAGAGIPKGTLSASINYPTQKYGNRAFRIYTPPGYSATRAEKYPVLYLHHGIGGNESAWVTGEGSADKVMDYLYSQAGLGVTPMLVVMPMGNMTGTSGDAWANYEEVEKSDLAPYIEKTYNASPSAAMRAIAGLSMGAGQTLNFGYKNPTFYNWIGAFSPAPNTIAAATTVKDIAAVKANIKLHFLAAGTAETGYLNTARTYHDFLARNGVAPLFLQVEQGLNHEKENWNRQLHNFAQRLFKNAGTGITISPRAGVSRTHSRILFPVLRASAAVFSGGPRGNRQFILDGRNISLLPNQPLD